MRGVPVAPPLRDIVLVGGGHAHVQVLKSFGMKPPPGLRLTVIAREPHTPYSGMLPGYVAGIYGFDDIHIDLARLSAFGGARFVAAEVTGIDPDERRLHFADRPSMRYDTASLNTGGVPGAAHGVAAGVASEFVTPVKPIGSFLPRWRRLLAARPDRVALVGGGAGAVELALAIAGAQPDVGLTLLADEPELLPHYPGRARRVLGRALANAGVEVVAGFRATAAEGGIVEAADGRQCAADHVLWVTGVDAPSWPRDAGLACDEAGFVRVNRQLQSVSHPDVFAVGDVASLDGQARPKSGVYAVRQGPTLSENLRRHADGRPLCRYRAQRHALAIIGLGEGRALAVRGRGSVSGRGVWRLKQWIDRRFMERFDDLPEMAVDLPTLPAALQADAPDEMRCGGCGAKLGADILARVQERLAVPVSAATERGIGDDAAVIRLPNKAVGAAPRLAASCDAFRAMIDDPYRFGRISAHHALNDLFAMAATPAFALALVTVPVMADAMMEEDLYQLMAGALAVFTEHGVDLVGGHSAEGAELSLGFAVHGYLSGPALEKGGMLPGQRLVLTKPVGTGTLLAGAMRGKTKARHLLAAVEQMDASNAGAAEVLLRFGATACTDVTGFGFAGHLTEMTRASGTGARIELGPFPTLEGALDSLEAGIASSLQASNELALADFAIYGAAPNAAAVRLLADPQTAGGLLASVPAENVGECLTALHEAGYTDASVVGDVTESELEVRA